MKNPDLYHRTIDILSRAYIADDLRLMDCASCVVGQLVAENCGYTYNNLNQWSNRRGDIIEPVWEELIWEDQDIENMRDAKLQIKATGYTIDELRSIENAAMDNSSTTFKSLMAVINILDVIHDNRCPMLTKSTKKKFKI